MLGGYRVVARQLPSSGAKGGDLTVEVGDATGDGAGEDRYTLVVKQGGKPVETHQVTTKRGKENVVPSSASSPS